MPPGTNYWIGLKNKPQNPMGMDLLKFYYNLESATFLSPDPARPIPTHELRESVQSANPECGEANAFPLGRTEFRPGQINQRTTAEKVKGVGPFLF
ncbi:MAG: hypothetical protein ACKVHR_18225 [Pirellulales bacterium]|jgi:hypothetical protein